MVHYIIEWDLPDQKANLTIYANKAKNDWLPVTLSHQGVIEIRNYRNPLEITPQVAITVDFESLEAWRDYLDSEDYTRIMRELRILGSATSGPSSGPRLGISLNPYGRKKSKPTCIVRSPFRASLSKKGSEGTSDSGRSIYNPIRDQSITPPPVDPS